MRDRTAPRAFTLVEAIIAVVVLSIALPPMLWALRESHAARVSPIRSSTARWLAVERLEDIIADRHSAALGYDHLIPSNYPVEPTVPGFPAFGRGVTIIETGADLATAGAGYKRITVTITWMEGAEQRSLSVSTIVTDYTS